MLRSLGACVRGWMVPCGLAIAVAPALATIVPDESAVRAGQRLFHSAVAADGTDLQASLFGGEAKMAGAAVACAACHGADGSGRLDAGIRVPDIRWETLTRERSPQPGGVARPAYDELSLLRALRLGVDPAGRRLAAAMPRFELTPGQAAQLVGYLQRVGTPRDQAPGVDDEAVRVAIVTRGGQEAAAHAAATAGCLREANEQGGIYGRRVTWTVRQGQDLRDETAWRQLADDVAMVLAPAWSNQQQLDHFSRFAAREHVLVLGPIGTPSDNAARTGTTFRVVADPLQGWHAVLEHLAVSAAGAGRQFVVWAVKPEDPAAAAEWEAVRTQAARMTRLSWHDVAGSELARPAAGGRLAPDAVLVLGDAAQVAKVDRELAAAGVPDAVPVVGTSARLGPAAARLPDSARARLLMVHTHPLEAELRPQRLLEALQAQGTRLTAPALQTTAFAAGCLAVEALRRAGRRITHVGLREALESVRELDTGVTMPLTYGARQRQGVWGARLVRLQGERLVAVSPWLAPSADAP